MESHLEKRGPNFFARLGKIDHLPTEAFAGAIIATLVIAVVAAGCRTYYRVRYLKKLHTDDYFLFYAVVAAIAGISEALWFRKPMFAGLIALQSRDPSVDRIEVGLFLMKFYTTIPFVLYSSIFTVKLSFIFFFRTLIGRVWPLHAWWWVVLVICLPSGIVVACIPFYQCSDLTYEGYKANCTLAVLNPRINTYIIVSATLDMLTDVLIISIPALLLARLHVDWRRKLGIACILCLSVFMVLIAIVRLGFNGAWPLFWTCIETNVAIIMVSATAIRGLFGQPHRKRQQGAHPAKRRRPQPPIRIRGAEDPTRSTSTAGSSSRGWMRVVTSLRSGHHSTAPAGGSTNGAAGPPVALPTLPPGTHEKQRQARAFEPLYETADDEFAPPGLLRGKSSSATFVTDRSSSDTSAGKGLGHELLPEVPPPVAVPGAGPREARARSSPTFYRTDSESCEVPEEVGARGWEHEEEEARGRDPAPGPWAGPHN